MNKQQMMNKQQRKEAAAKRQREDDIKQVEEYLAWLKDSLPGVDRLRIFHRDYRNLHPLLHSLISPAKFKEEICYTEGIISDLKEILEKMNDK